MTRWFFKLAAYFPALAFGLVALYFLQRGYVLSGGILTTVSAVLALGAILFREAPGG